MRPISRNAKATLKLYWPQAQVDSRGCFSLIHLHDHCISMTDVQFRGLDWPFAVYFTCLNVLFHVLLVVSVLQSPSAKQEERI